MKKVKAGTYTGRKCSWCKSPAAWRESGHAYKFACDTHKPDLQAHEKANRDDGHMSEADYQTWGRL